MFPRLQIKKKKKNHNKKHKNTYTKTTEAKLNKREALGNFPQHLNLFQLYFNTFPKTFLTMTLNFPRRQTKHYMLGKVASTSLMMTDFPRIVHGPNLHNKKIYLPGIPHRGNSMI